MSKMIKMIILIVAGMCLLTGFVMSTTASTNILVESDHSYANNFNYIWPEISQPETTQMRFHFTKLDLSDYHDKLTLLDKDGNTLVTFRNYNKEDFWTEWYTGNTIKVKLETNGYDTAYGFKIDQVETRNNMAPSGGLPESYHSYANNFNYIWPEISQPEATQTRFHFTKLDLADYHDKLTLLDKDGNTLVTFRNYDKDDFWTEWYTGNTIKVKLETNGYDTAYGFKIDQIETRKNPESITVDENETPSLNSATFAYITNFYDNNVSVIDTSTNTVTATVNVGSNPAGVAVNPDGSKVYVTNWDSVSVIDTATNKVTATVPGIYPSGVVVSPDGTKVYVANSGSANVSVISTATNTVVAIVHVGTNPYGIEISPDGTKAYVTNQKDSSVSIINTTTNTVTATVPVDYNPSGIVASPDGTKAYVTNSDYYGKVTVINTTTNTVTATVPVGIKPTGVAITLDGKKVYVTNKGSNSVSIIDTASNTVIDTVNAGDPLGVSITPDGTKVYVTNYNSNTASVIATSNNTVTDIVPVGNGPTAFGKFIGPSLKPLSLKPVANFYSPETDSVLNGTAEHDLLAGDQVSFFDNSKGSPTSWYWDFGDGNTSIQQNPTHTYGKRGGYTVNLTVTNSAGNDTISRYGYVPVEAGERPVPANFSSDVTSGNAPLTVTFHDDDVDGPSGIGPIWREWDFGDGVIESYLVENNASATPYATHKYENPGKYTVTLYMDNRVGHSIITKYNYINVTGYPAGDAPIAAFTANVTSGSAPLKVLFTDTGTGGVPTSWYWDFGNGIYSKHAMNATHTFTNPGVYNISLTVANANGSNTTTKPGFIVVGGGLKAPVAEFTANVTSGKAPLVVKFTDTGTGGSPASWLWDFGDGIYSKHAMNATHTFTNPGVYDIILTVKNSAGSNTKIMPGYITVS